MAKILLIASLPTTGRPQRSSFIYDFAVALAKRHEVLVLATYDYNTRPVLHVPGAKMFSIASFRAPFYSLIISPMIVLRATRIVLRRRVDIIHTHYIGFVALLAIIVGKICGIPVVATAHRGDVSPKPFERSFLTLLSIPFAKLSLRMLDSTICVSNYVLKEAKKLYPPAHCALIYNSVDEERFLLRNRKETRTKVSSIIKRDISRAKVILFVGALIHRKGVHRLFEAAMEPAFSTMGDIELFIIGEGPARDNLSKVASNGALAGKVVMMGSVSRDMLPLFYSSADLFVLPSLDEGHPVALLEAMASGLPVVATNVGGIPECVVEGYNGFLVDPLDIEAISRASKVALGSAIRLGMNSRRLYEQRFSRHLTMELHCRLYSRLVRHVRRFS